MSQALIFVDNLRIGGFQRLALDEAYGLSDQGIKCTIITLEDPTIQPTHIRYLSSIESELIQSKRIVVKVMPSSRRKLHKNLRLFLGNLDSTAVIISHSLRATFILRIIKLRTPSINLNIKTKIHQIPTLIDSKQRFKRFIYAQFTDELFCFSEAVRISWDGQLGRGLSGLSLLTKRISLLRNGIYLPRLPKMSVRPEGDISKPRLIFLGRLTFWKGLEVLERLAKEPLLAEFDFLFVIPTYDENDLKAISNILGNRMVVISGKSVGDLQVYPGDVHLYPTQYGDRSSVIESVSLNCLEMAGIGIPSVITAGGQLTWSELEFNEIFFEVDWRNIDDVVSQISKASKLRIDTILHRRLHELISIDNELVVLKE